jgi:hypothetical protein
VVACQSPRLLYSATLGMAAMILLTPTGLWQDFAWKRPELRLAMRDKPIRLGTRGDSATTPVGLGNSPPSFPRVAEYSNPGLEDGSPAGIMFKLWQVRWLAGRPFEFLSNQKYNVEP